MSPLERLRHHVSGAIERGESSAVIEQAPRPPADKIKARIFIGSTAAYCAITAPAGKSLDILLDAGRGAPQSLRETAAEWRAHAARLIKNAELAESAADIL